MTASAHTHQPLRAADRSVLPGDAFRSALAAHPAGVVVVTGHDGDGPVGMTATSFVSLSLDPPLVAFAVASTSSTWRRLRHVDSVVVHLLAEHQQSLAERFAARGLDRFGEPTRWLPLTTGEPLLAEVDTWLRCRTEQHLTLGDHVLVVSRVLQTRVGGEAAPLVYHQRGYRAFRALDDG